MRSTNNGQSWDLVVGAPGHYYFLGLHPNEPNLAFTENLRSSDGGATWQVIPYLKEHGAAILGLCAAHPDTLSAMNTERREIFRSDDRGGSWRSYV